MSSCNIFRMISIANTFRFPLKLSSAVNQKLSSRSSRITTGSMIVPCYSIIHSLCSSSTVWFQQALILQSVSVGLNRDFFKLLNGRRDIAQTGYMHVNSILQQIFPLENAILMLCLPPPTRTGDCVPKVCNLAIHSRCSFCFMAFKHSRNELLSSCPILHCPSYVQCLVYSCYILYSYSEA